MADSAGDNTQRSTADKERSRQLSRSVSGKEAARGSTRGGRAQGAQGRRGQERRGQRPQSGRGAAPRQAGRGGAQRPGARRPPARRPIRSGRSRRSLFVWGAVALVVIIVGVVIGIGQTSSPTTKGIHYTPTPVPAAILHEITHVPTSAFNSVGTGLSGAITPPQVLSGQKLFTYHGKPGVFSALGEFCPYCAAERWAIITSLSRFGTFTGLKTMQSSPKDVYPRTQTFTFKTTTYTSRYIAANLLEIFGQEKSTGARPVINKPNKAEDALLTKYDPTRTNPARSGNIPFTDVGNKFIFSGASFVPQPLQTLSRATIARGLKDPSNGVTKLILGVSNFMSAAICNIDGGKPGAVCSSSGVKAAASALKLTG